jgi:hypothetical protein
VTPEQWEDIIFGIGFGLGVLILGTIILVVVISQAGKIWAAREASSRETEYKKLAAQATNYQRRAVAEQEKLTSQLSEVTARLTSIERILQQVE